MARWEPNARERLERAALALFTEHGFDATTVAEIADRAGLTKSTFFRHFADKREVLFGGQDMLVQLFSSAIVSSARGDDAEGLAAALGPPRSRSPRTPRSRAAAAAVIAAHSELQERELLKRARSRPRPWPSSARSRRRRGDRAPGRRGRRARLQHRLRALGGAGNLLSFTEIAHAALRELQASAAGRAGRTPSRR